MKHQGGVSMWRIMDTKKNDGFYNMAVDEALLNVVAKGQSPPILRFYSWNPPSISIGYFQRIHESVDLNFCAESNIDVVRRPTGGRTVFHNQELTYSVIIPESHKFAKGSVTETYKNISKGLLEGLKKAGIPVDFSHGNRDKMNSSACFTATSKYEIVLARKKIVGSAQMRKKGVLLQHGSILLDFDVELFSKCLFLTEEKRRLFLEKYKKKATDIYSEMGFAMDRNTLIEGIKFGFTNHLAITLKEDGMQPMEEEIANEIYEKYRSNEWNFLK
jgi:lipoate-protein ligase A